MVIISGIALVAGSNSAPATKEAKKTGQLLELSFITARFYYLIT